MYLAFFLLNDLPIRGMSWAVFRSSRKYPIVAGIGLGMSVSSIFCSAMFFPIVPVLHAGVNRNCR